MNQKTQAHTEYDIYHVVSRLAVMLGEQWEERQRIGQDHRSLFAEYHPGKFEGEHLSTRYYWSEDGEDWHEGESDAYGYYRAWRILPVERAAFSFPDDAAWFVAMENGQGFVTGEHMTESAYDSLVESVTADYDDYWGSEDW